MPHILSNPRSYVGISFVNAKGNAECVEFIKQKLSAPHTGLWRAGIPVKPVGAGESDPIAPGTAIATFVNGRYPQTGHSGMHAAIYLGQNVLGIQVLDQWRTSALVSPRTIYWNPKQRGLSNDGNAFSTIEW